MACSVLSTPQWRVGDYDRMVKEFEDGGEVGSMFWLEQGKTFKLFFKQATSDLGLGRVTY